MIELSVLVDLVAIAVAVVHIFMAAVGAAAGDDTDG